MRIVFRTEDSALPSLLLFPAHHKMEALWFWILKELREKGYDEIVWTSHHRPKSANDSGVHDTNPCRARDFFVPGMGSGESIVFADHVNRHWKYGTVSRKTDKPFKVLIWHDVGRGAHFHAQTRDETIQK